jgi:hypothetical protein
VNSTAVHEASHVTAATLLGRRVDHTWVAVGSVLPGETAGHASIPIDNEIEPSQLVIALIGYMSTNAPNSPPSFADACVERLEGLWMIMLSLNATEEKYNKTVEFTRELLTDPNFVALRDSVARALSRVPRIERETIEKLAEIYVDPDPIGATHGT